jgi:hypothetical protein
VDTNRFREECQQLARPRLNLRRRRGPGDVVAIWGGSGCLPPPSGAWRHRITVACDWLNRNGFSLSGLLGIYENLEDVRRLREQFTVVQADQPAHALLGSDSIELVGTEDVALPPERALEVYGSEEMREALDDPGQADLFESYTFRCPLHYADDEGIYAMLGGWHELWPENDAYDDEPGRLVLWTFKDAEPWLEVWQRPSGQVEVIPPIT